MVWRATVGPYRATRLDRSCVFCLLHVHVSYDRSCVCWIVTLIALCSFLIYSMSLGYRYRRARTNGMGWDEMDRPAYRSSLVRRRGKSRGMHLLGILCELLFFPFLRLLLV